MRSIRIMQRGGCQDGPSIRGCVCRIRTINIQFGEPKNSQLLPLVFGVHMGISQTHLSVRQQRRSDWDKRELDGGAELPQRTASHRARGAVALPLQRFRAGARARRMQRARVRSVTRRGFRAIEAARVPGGQGGEVGGVPAGSGGGAERGERVDEQPQHPVAQDSTAR